MPPQPVKSSDPQPSGRKSKSGFAEARRRRLSTQSLVLTLAFCVSCSGFNDPIEAPLPDEIALESARPDLPEDDQPEFDPTEPETDFEMEEPLAWNDLTRLAREHRSRGELVEARERLAQAAIQVADLDPTDVQRRTVFGLRARLASEFAARGDVETADEMADQLFEEAEESPELAGKALVSLAVSVAERRADAEQDDGEPEYQLSLFRIALEAAAANASSRDRMDLAFAVAQIAQRQNDLELARTAIDQAVSDARVLIPGDQERIAVLQLVQARIAFAQGDLDWAEASVKAAIETFDEQGADASTLAMAESLLVEILAKKGSVEAALEIARGAHDRIDGEEPITDHAKRRVLAALSHAELAAGDRAAARLHLESALAIPGTDVELDVVLAKELARELQEWEDSQQPPDASPSVPKADSPGPSSSSTTSTPAND